MFVLVFILPVARAYADLIDPATLQIGNPPTGGDPNLISSAFGIYQNSNSPANALYNPLLLIIGIPNVDASSVIGGSFPLPGISVNNGGTGQLGGADVYGGNWNYGAGSPSGFGGDMTSGDEIYSFLGITGTDHSNSFTNWSGADKTLGIDPTEFATFVFELTDTNINLYPNKQVVDVTLSGIKPGTLAVAYGQDATHLYDTPFTQAGMINKVPEPSSIFLLGSGVLGLALLFCYRRRELV
ncbi:MAG: PEP-CTERM sorting domain-containing protein [Actinomycetota bacterium]|nr:PEP-CTERM sorting domain-containing protein [Actinomycetota bacterium]